MNKNTLLLACSLALGMFAMGGVVNNGVKQVSAEEAEKTSGIMIWKSGSNTTEGDVIPGCLASYDHKNSEYNPIVSGEIRKYDKYTMIIRAPGYVMTSLTLRMHSKVSNGRGGLSINGDEIFKEYTPFEGGWSTKWTESWVDVDINLDPVENKALDDCGILISGNVNSLFVDSYTLGWEKVQPKETFATNSETLSSLSFSYNEVDGAYTEFSNVKMRFKTEYDFVKLEGETITSTGIVVSTEELSTFRTSFAENATSTLNGLNGNYVKFENANKKNTYIAAINIGDNQVKSIKDTKLYAVGYLVTDKGSYLNAGKEISLNELVKAYADMNDASYSPIALAFYNYLNA